MNTKYITNSIRINSDFAVSLFSNGEQADQKLTLRIAPAYQDGSSEPMAAAYIECNADPYPLAIQTTTEILFGVDAFGGTYPNYTLDSDLATWLTPEAIERRACDFGEDKHFAFALADAIRTQREKAAVEFLEGFNEATALEDSAEQWAGFSRQLSDHERTRIELGGYEAGRAEGEKFREIHPTRSETVAEILAAKESAGDDAYLWLHSSGDCILWPSEDASQDDNGAKALQRWQLTKAQTDELIATGECDDAA
jgi:hypothetical protein